jgi:hypothetical protein
MLSALAAVLYFDATTETARGIPAPQAHLSRIGVEQEVSGFDLADAKGTRYTVAPRADWGATEALSLRLRATYHTLWLADGTTRSGVGDAELRLKARVVDIDEHFLVQVGVIETLPTGNASRGLGNGAMVLSPFVTSGRKIGRTIIYAYVSDAITLRNEKARVYDDFTDPSTNHETRNALGVIAGPSSVFQTNASLNATTILTGSSFGDTFLFGAAFLVFAPSELFRLQLGGQLPIAGEHRFEWKGVLDAYVFL